MPFNISHNTLYTQAINGEKFLTVILKFDLGKRKKIIIPLNKKIQKYNALLTFEVFKQNLNISSPLMFIKNRKILKDV